MSPFTQTGRFLGHHSAFSNAVLRRFVHLFQFSGVELVSAIRLLFSKFQPPGWVYLGPLIYI